jgi:dipeptidyl aminopeptidase/acylaminoacyl peptidase
MPHPLALSLLLLAAQSPAEPAPSPQRLALTDLGRVHQITALELSADGSRAVYVLRSVTGDLADREATVGYRSHLWFVDLAASRPPRALTAGDREGTAPAVAPAGDWLAFLRAGAADRPGAGKPQVWCLPLDGPGEAEQWTEFEHGAGAPQWFPTGDQLLVPSSRPQSELEAAPPYDYERPGRRFGDVPEGEETDRAGAAEERAPSPAPDTDLDTLRRFLEAGSAADDPVTIFDLDFQGEQGLDGEPTFDAVYRVAFSPGAATRSAPTEWLGGHLDPRALRLSPDGARLACSLRPPGTAHPDRVQRRVLAVFELDQSAPQILVDDPALSADAPQWSADGRTLYFEATPTAEPAFEQTGLAAVPAGGGAARLLLAEWDADLELRAVTGGAQGERLWFTSPREGRVRAYELDPTSGDPRTVLDVAGAVLQLAAAGDRALCALATGEHPGEVFELAGGAARRLSDHHHTWLAELELSPHHERWTTSPDGTRVQYWVLPPVGLRDGQRYPTVLSLHGGPMVMWGPGSHTMWHEWQWLAARGYGLVYPNPRGSNGYGRAFQRANYQNWGAGPAADALAALDAAAAEFGWIDRERLVLTGGSYAGYLTAWIVAHDGRFRAAVAQRGVYDLATFFGEGNAWRLVPECFGGYPWEPETRAVLERESPFSHVASIHTPLLITHGSQDLRTGVSQSEMLYKALKVLGRPVEYVRYPGAGHELSRSGDPHQRLDRLGRIYEFFERHLDRVP